MGTALDDALKRLRSAGGLTANRNASLIPSVPQYSTALTRALQSPQIQSSVGSAFGGWQAPQPDRNKGPGGLFGAALKTLDFGRAAIVSSFKESIDLAQDVLAGRLGDGEWSPSEWWEQATNHYGFGDLIEDERDWVGGALIASSPFNMGAGLLLGAGVLADNIWADRVIGFIGDVAVDPLIFMGGFGAISRGLGASKVVTRLGKVANAVDDDLLRMGFKDASLYQEVRAAAGAAATAASQGRSLSAAARSLGKSGRGGKAVSRQLGLDPGLRIRMPGTGPLGRFMKQDQWLQAGAKKLGKEDWLVRQQYKNIAPMYKNLYDEDTLIKAIKGFKTTGFRKQADKAAKATRGLDDELAKIAGEAARSPVEFVLPGFVRGGARAGLAAKAIAQISDFPIRGSQKLPKSFRDKVSVLLNPSHLLREMQQSDNPVYNVMAAQMEDWMRHARGREHAIMRGVGEASDDLVKRSAGLKISDTDLSDFVEYYNALVKDDSFDLLDTVFRSSGQINRDPNNLWYANLPAAVKALDDESFFQLALKAEQYVQVSSTSLFDTYARVPLGQTEKVWEAGAAVEAAEKMPWRVARRLTEGARRRFMHSDFFDRFGEPRTNLDYRRVENKFGGSKQELPWDSTTGHPKGRSVPGSLQSRAIGAVNEPVFVWHEAGAAPDSIVDFYNSAGVKLGRVLADPLDSSKPWLVADPNKVGKSVRRQIDDRSLAVFGERAYENEFSVMSDAWRKGMGRDIRVEELMKRLSAEYPAERLADMQDDVLQTIADYAETEASRIWRVRSAKGRARTAKSKAEASRRAEQRAGERTERIGQKSEELHVADRALAQVDAQIAAWNAEMREIENAVEAMGLEMEVIAKAAKKADTQEYKRLLVRAGEVTAELSEASARREFILEMVPRVDQARESFEGIVLKGTEDFAADVEQPLQSVVKMAEAAGKAQRVYTEVQRAWTVADEAERAAIAEYRRLVDGGELRRLEGEAVAAADEVERTAYAAAAAAQREVEIMGQPGRVIRDEAGRKVGVEASVAEQEDVLRRLTQAEVSIQKDLDALVGAEGTVYRGAGAKVLGAEGSPVAAAEAAVDKPAVAKALKFLEVRAAEAKRIKSELESVKAALAEFADDYSYPTPVTKEAHPLGAGVQGIPSGGVRGATPREVKRAEKFAGGLRDVVAEAKQSAPQRAYDRLPPQARLVDPPKRLGKVSEDFTQTGVSTKGPITRAQAADWRQGDIDDFLKAGGRFADDPGEAVPAATVSYDDPTYWTRGELGDWTLRREEAADLGERVAALKNELRRLTETKAGKAEAAKRARVGELDKKIADREALIAREKGRVTTEKGSRYLAEARKNLVLLRSQHLAAGRQGPPVDMLKNQLKDATREFKRAKKITDVQERLGKAHVGTTAEHAKEQWATQKVVRPGEEGLAGVMERVTGRGPGAQQSIAFEPEMFPAERGYRTQPVEGFPHGRPPVKLGENGKRRLKAILARRRKVTAAAAKLSAGDEMAATAEGTVAAHRKAQGLRKQARVAKANVDTAEAARSGAETNAKVAWENAERAGPRVTIEPWETGGPSSGRLVAVNRGVDANDAIAEVRLRDGERVRVRVRREGGSTEWKRVAWPKGTKQGGPSKTALKKQGWRFYEDGPVSGERGFVGELGPDDPLVKQLENANAEQFSTAEVEREARFAFKEVEQSLGLPYRHSLEATRTHPVVPNKAEIRQAEQALRRAKKADRLNAHTRLEEVIAESRRYTAQEGAELQRLYSALVDAEEAAQIAVGNVGIAQRRVQQAGGMSAQARARWAADEASEAGSRLAAGRQAAVQAEAGTPAGRWRRRPWAQAAREEPAPIAGYFDTLEEMRTVYQTDLDMLKGRMEFVKEGMELTNLNAAGISGNAPVVRQLKSLIASITGAARRASSYEIAGAPMLERGLSVLPFRPSTPLQRATVWERTLAEWAELESLLGHEAVVAATKAGRAVESRSGLEAFNRAYRKTMTDLGIDRATVDSVLSGGDPRSGADILLAGRQLESGEWTAFPKVRTADRGSRGWGDYEFDEVVARIKFGEELVKKRTQLASKRQRLLGEAGRTKGARETDLLQADKAKAHILQMELEAADRDLADMADYMSRATGEQRAEYARLGAEGADMEQAVKGAAQVPARDVQDALTETLESLGRRAQGVGGKFPDEAAEALAGGGPRRIPVDEATEGTLFSLNKNEQAIAQKALKDMFAHAEWGPWRLMSGDVALDTQMMDVIDAFARVNDHEEWGKLWQGWNKVQTYLKAAMIATPGFLNRNIYGAFFNAWLDGVNLNEIFRSAQMTTRVARYSHDNQVSFVEAARALAKDSDDALMDRYVKLLEVGVRGGGQAIDAVDLQIGLRNARNLEMLIGGRKGGKQYSVSFKPWSPRFAPYQSIRSLNSWIEDIVRLGVGMDTMRWGGTTDDALARIAKTQFDYDELTQHERKWMKSIFPFYTWTRKNVPYQLKQLGAHPSKYNKLLSAKRNLELGTDEEGVVPDYFLEPFGVRLPFSAKGGTVYSAPDIPFQDLARYDPFAGGVKEGVGGALRHLLGGASPILKTPIEVAFKDKLFSGIPFKGRYQTTPAAISKVPFLMEVLESGGWAKRAPSGDWKMRDHHIYMITNTLPSLGVIRRLFPNEPKYQRNLTRSILSTVFGMSAQFNTPHVQASWLTNQKYEAMTERQDYMDIISRER